MNGLCINESKLALPSGNNRLGANLVPTWSQHGTKTFMDDTLPGGPTERIITYMAPFDRCNREEDYEIAWAAFKARQENAK